MSGHPSVSFGIVCWIDEDSQLPELKRCLDSVKDLPVILVNGKWSDMEGDNPISTQKARDLINSYPNVKHILSPNESEVNNRNILLKCGTDYMIWIDTDEWAEFPNGIDFFKEELSRRFKDEYCAYSHSYDLKGRGGYFKVKRIIRNPHELEYRIRHNQLYHGSINVYDNPIEPIDGLMVHHSKDFRSQASRDKMINRRLSNPIH